MCQDSAGISTCIVDSSEFLCVCLCAYMYTRLCVYMPVWAHSNLYRFLLFCFCFKYWGMSLVLCMSCSTIGPAFPVPLKNFALRPGLALHFTGVHYPTRCHIYSEKMYLSVSGSIQESSSMWRSHPSHKEVCCVYAPVCVNMSAYRCMRS